MNKAYLDSVRLLLVECFVCYLEPVPGRTGLEETVSM